MLSNRLRQLIDAGFVEQVDGDGARSLYATTRSGRDLEPIIAAVARWYVHHAIAELGLDMRRFDETSPISILESLPFLLREERAEGVCLVFEIRLEGPGGGVWAVTIEDGGCRVEAGFAAKADVRYTANARIWCGVALGYVDARDATKRGLLTKEGGREAMDHYFHQVAHMRHTSAVKRRHCSIRWRVSVESRGASLLSRRRLVCSANRPLSTMSRRWRTSPGLFWRGGRPLRPSGLQSRRVRVSSVFRGA